jgi:PTH1 family peptidyl-tRNA hydrolase
MKRDATRGNPPTDALRLIACLGNPGRQYERTRHNVGWMVADGLAGSATWKEKFHGKFAKVGAVTLLKPETFMNHSGRSVQAAAAFFGLSGTSICVVHDDLETPFGTVQLTWGGGHRGQNGVRSVMQSLGTGDFWRLRVGVGRPPAHRSPGDWILERFAPDEEPRLPDIIRIAVRMLEEGMERPAEATRDG